MGRYEIETLVCGTPFIDIGLLRRHTSYGSGIGENDTLIDYLFEALESFTQEERCSFIR